MDDNQQLKYRFFDYSAAQTFIPVVKHAELTFGYRPLFFVKVNVNSAILYADGNALFFLTITKFRGTMKGLFLGRTRYPVAGV